MEGGWRGLPRAWGPPPLRARLRAAPEDFVVEELTAVRPEGRGEHLLVRVRKRGITTREAARRLACALGVPPREVGWAGLKDAEAVATQWLSVRVGPGAEVPRPETLEPEGLEVLEVHRHGRRLRPGALRGNRFVLRLRRVEGARDAAEARLARIAAGGVPNWFGPQRFARGGLARAAAWTAGRARPRDRLERGLWLSALRAALFNAVLAERVWAGLWARMLPGEVPVRAGGRWRAAEGAPDALPSGPLWGRGGTRAAGVAGALERFVAALHAGWAAHLERAGLRAERRALVLRPAALVWSWEGEDTLRLEMTLPRGAYATALVRELADTGEGRSPEASGG